MNKCRSGQEIFEKAIERIRTAGLNVHLLDNQPYAIMDRKPDAIITIGTGENRTNIVVNVHPSLPATSLAHVVTQVHDPGMPIMLITRYISPAMAELLVARNISFADTVGNISIRMPGIFMFISGRKPPRAELQPIRVFRPTGLQVIFALLCRPSLVKTSYRRIADVAGVSLGTVEHAMSDLVRLGHLVERSARDRALTNVRKLLDVWVMTYPQQLKPKRFLGRFRGLNPRWWENTDWRGSRALLGGEPAAAQVTGMLNAGKVTVYLEGEIDEFLLRNRLARDDDGETELLRTFWHFPYDWPYPHLTPPLLIYADLMATADARTIEMGKTIHDRYLAGLVREG